MKNNILSKPTSDWTLNMFKPRFWTENVSLCQNEMVYFRLHKSYGVRPMKVLNKTLESVYVSPNSPLDATLFNTQTLITLQNRGCVFDTSKLFIVGSNTALSLTGSVSYPSLIEQHNYRSVPVSSSDVSSNSDITEGVEYALPFGMLDRLDAHLSIPAFHETPEYIKLVSFSSCVMNAFHMDKEVFKRKVLLLNIICLIFTLASLLFLFFTVKCMFVSLIISLSNSSTLSATSFMLKGSLYLCAFIYSCSMLIMYSHIRWQAKTDSFGSYYDRYLMLRNEVNRFFEGKL